MAHRTADPSLATAAIWQRRSVLVAAVFVLPAWGQPKSLTLTRITKGAEWDRTEEALRVAYANLGWQLEFTELPAERAMLESNAGRADGETARVAGIDARYKNLRCVEVPLHVSSLSIFVKGADKPVPATLAELSRLPRVGMVVGRKVTEDATAGWTNVTRVTNSASALQMLRLGRIDAYLGRAEDFLLTMRQEGVDVSDYAHRVALRFELFHYLHKKHEALLPAITAELRRIKGTREAVVTSGI